MVHPKNESVSGGKMEKWNNGVLFRRHSFGITYNL